MRFYTYYYGGMHDCWERNLAAGTQVDEWKLLENSSTPIQPLLGQWDDSSIETLEKEILIAQTYGVDGFIMNFYHNGETAELYKPIDAFCSTESNCEVQFALNWCYRMPRRSLPVPLKFDFKKTKHLIHAVIEQDKSITTTLDALKIENIINYASKKYFQDPRYIKIGEKLYFSIYHVTGLLGQYGVDGANMILQLFRKKADKLGFKLHLVGLLSMAPEDDEFTPEINKLEFDSLTSYCCLPDFRIAKLYQDYKTLSLQRVDGWNECLKLYSKTFYPCISAGWNATARGEKGYDPTIHGLVFPWAPIVTQNNSKNFGFFLEQAVKFARLNLDKNENIVILGPWNEWTEGCYLLPDSIDAYSKLEVVKSIKQKYRRNYI